MDDHGFATTPPDLSDAAVQARFAELFRYAQVGRCVNAVAHDINNQLGAAMAYAELVGLDQFVSPEARRMLGEIVESVSRCADLVAHLTDIARPARVRANSVDPGDTLQRVLGMRQYEHRQRQIRVETEIAADVPTLLADAPQVQMALIHLIFNAEEALHDAEAPRLLRVSLQPTPEGAGVIYTVWNNAPPVPEAWRAQLGLPFAFARGGLHLGYGLAAARQVAELHGGSLAYDPEAGFALRLVRLATDSGA